MARDMATAGVGLAAYLALTAIARGYSIDGVMLRPWCAAPAVSFALVARRGAGWSAFALAAPLAAAWVSGELTTAPLGAAVRAAGEAVACAGSAVLLRGTPPVRPQLLRLKRVGAFFAFTAAAAALAAVCAVLSALFAGSDLTAAAAVAPRAFLALVVALALVAPALLVPHPLRGPARPGTGSVLQAVVLALVGWHVFGRFVGEEVSTFYLLFLPCAWIATRHGQIGTALALALLYAAAAASDHAYPRHEQAVAELQVRLAVLAGTSLLLGAMVNERQAAETRVLARQADLAHVQRLNIGWEMASALAHELNQPLTAAMNYAQAALRLTPADTNAATLMGRSVDQIERAGRIIHGLRGFMQKGPLCPAATRLAEVVEDAVLLVAPEAGDSGVMVQVANLAALPPVLADRTQVEQVLVNLLRNASQAVAATGAPEGLVHVSGRHTGQAVEVVVADTGPGIPAEVADRLFEPFVTTKAAGMGLGLSISRSIVESHGGRLWAESNPAGGTLFRFTLPLAGKEDSHA